jgi:hypothetical protein
VTRHPKYPDLYEIRLLQSWKTLNYYYKGWLFLLIQFRKGEQPLIWVRTIDHELAI